MIITCESCGTRFKVADEKISDKGARVRCSKCGHVFQVAKDGAVVSGAAGAAPSPAAGAAPGFRTGNTLIMHQQVVPGAPGAGGPQRATTGIFAAPKAPSGQGAGGWAPPPPGPLGGTPPGGAPGLDTTVKDPFAAPTLDRTLEDPLRPPRSSSLAPGADPFAPGATARTGGAPGQPSGLFKAPPPGGAPQLPPASFDPFGAVVGGAGPGNAAHASGGDPRALFGPAGIDLSAGAPDDPFAAPTKDGGDPFGGGAPSADPFAGPPASDEPFAAPTRDADDPFSGIVGADMDSVGEALFGGGALDVHPVPFQDEPEGPSRGSDLFPAAPADGPPFDEEDASSLPEPGKTRVHDVPEDLRERARPDAPAAAPPPAAPPEEPAEEVKVLRATPRVPSGVFTAVSALVQAVFFGALLVLAVVLGRGGSVGDLLAGRAVGVVLGAPGAVREGGLVVDEVDVVLRSSPALGRFAVVSGVVVNYGGEPVPGAHVEVRFEGDERIYSGWAKSPFGSLELRRATTRDGLLEAAAVPPEAPALGPGERAPFVVVAFDVEEGARAAVLVEGRAPPAPPSLEEAPIVEEPPPPPPKKGSRKGAANGSRKGKRPPKNAAP